MLHEIFDTNLINKTCMYSLVKKTIISFIGTRHSYLYRILYDGSIYDTRWCELHVTYRIFNIDIR